MTQKVIVLMLGHRSLVGKDTSAEFLKTYDWQRIAFADKLKSTVADLYNFSHEQMHGELKDVEDKRYPNTVDPETITVYEEDEWGPIPFPGYNHKEMNPIYKPFLTPRRVLQIFGQDQRKIYPDIWAQYVFNQIDMERCLSSNPTQTFKYIITDFRFKNEFEVAKRWSEKKVEGPVDVEKYVFPIKINRNVIAKSGPNDISEHDLDDFDGWYRIIDNNKAIDELYASMWRISENILWEISYKNIEQIDKTCVE